MGSGTGDKCTQRAGRGEQEKGKKKEKMPAKNIAGLCDDEATVLIQQLVDANLHSPDAGCLASNNRVAMMCNTVGGTNIHVRLSQSTMNMMFLSTTRRHFTGIICRPALNSGPSLAEFTVLGFGPGSFQIMGARNKIMLLQGMWTLIFWYREKGLPAKPVYVSIDNNVARGDVGHDVDLAAMNGKVPGFLSAYCPARFPGLVLGRQVDTADGVRLATMTLFPNGRTMILGISDKEAANMGYFEVCQIARQYRVDSNSSRVGQLGRDRTTSFENERNRSEKQNKKEMKATVKLADFIFDFLTRNRHRAGDTDFERNKQALFDAELAARLNGPAPARKSSARAGRRGRNAKRSAAVSRIPAQPELIRLGGNRPFVRSAAAESVLSSDSDSGNDSDDRHAVEFDDDMFDDGGDY
jgi:TATA-box binding protein (TBP) (component of TFIID and TFIIIB)